MAKRMALLVSTMMVASMTIAAGTGPTHPEKSREHPLDSREPRQDIIDDGGDSQAQPRPPTLEAPPEVPPVESIEAPSQPTRPGAEPGVERTDPNSAS